MALSDSYASPEQYRSAVIKSSNEDDTDLVRELSAISRYIDRKLGRTLGFSKDAADVDRLYMPVSSRPLRVDWAETENPWKYGGLSRRLDIDDLVSLTSITVDESLNNTFGLSLTASDYELLPRNAATMPEPEPYRMIELTSWGRSYAWTRNARVKVTGKFGWPSVPKAIVSATIELCAIWRQESDRASGRMLDAGTVLNVDGAAQNILNDLARHYMNPAVLV